jgi:tRNA splicing ligase
MVPYIPIPVFRGGPAEVVKAHNEVVHNDLLNPYCLSTHPKITETNVKVLEHIVEEFDEKKLETELFPVLVIRDIAEAKGAKAVINYKIEVKYKGFWLWKTLTYIKISGDAVKIEHPHMGEAK